MWFFLNMYLQEVLGYGAFESGLALLPMTLAITATAAARAEDGGLASGLVNTTYQVGSAIGLAAMVAVAGARTSSLAATGSAAAMNGGFSAAFVCAGVIAFAAALLAALGVRAPGPSVQGAAVAVGS